MAKTRQNSNSCCDDRETCTCLPRIAESGFAATTFIEGDELYREMLASITAATSDVCIETFILASDKVGDTFLDALRRAAEKGVRVRILLDSVGSKFWISEEFKRALSQGSIECRWYQPWMWSQPGRYNRRNHRKLLVVDKTVAYLGGFNIHKENSLKEVGQGRIRDTHVRVVGELAMEAHRQFDAIWGNDMDFADSQPESGDAVLLSNMFRNCRRRFHCLYQALLAEAQNSVDLTTPYFVPDHRTQKALCDAAKRGVQVSLLVPEKHDARIVWWAARAAYAPLLASGVQIFEYQARPLHAKVAVVDGTRSIVGSANLDYRSFFTNYELCLLVASKSFAEQLEKQFRTDIALSREVVESEWSDRAWSQRFCESVGWVGRKWL